MSHASPASRDARSEAIGPIDRILDAIALLILASGVLLFTVGRSSLAQLATNEYQAPPQGVTWISRAELHDAQTRWGAYLAGAGLVLCVGAAVRHRSTRRRAS